MADFASFAGVRIVSGTLTIPLLGMWSADVMLATVDGIQNTGQLVIGNLSLKGTAYRQAPFAGQRNCRLIAGSGGLRKTVTARHYAFSGGVSMRLVLQDVAREVGETINVPVDRIIGTSYVRPVGPASNVLRDMVGDSWYVDPAGVVQIATWPARRLNSEFTVIVQDGGAGRVEVATEDYAAFLPNTSFASSTLETPVVNGGVSYNFGADGKLRLEVLTQ